MWIKRKPGEPIFLVGGLLHPVVGDLCKGATRAAILTWKHLNKLAELRRCVVYYTTQLCINVCFESKVWGRNILFIDLLADFEYF